MLRAFKVVPAPARDLTTARRQRRCIPSICESASSLEDRVLLSGAGHHAAAEVGRPMAETAAGQRVTALFESILHTDPTGQQLNHWVHELRVGVNVNSLRKDLTAEAQAGSGTPASATMDLVIGSDPSASASGAASRAGGGGVASLLPDRLNSSSAANGLDVRQLPRGMSLTVGHTGGSGGGTMITTMNSGSATGTRMSSPMSSSGTMMSTGAMSSSGTMSSGSMTTSGGMMSSSGMMTTSVTISSTSPTMTGVSDTNAIGKPTPLSLSPLPLSPMIVTPV